MLILVTGGAGSGKSAAAEKLITDSGIYPRTYVACMAVRDEEDRLRVKRHEALRAGKDFITVEAPLALAGVKLPEGGAALIEDISNLAANECFSTREGFHGAAERILSGVRSAARRSALTVVVSCEIGCDGARYDETTIRYIRLLADVNAAVAGMADEVYEVVCGIPCTVKGGAR